MAGGAAGWGFGPVWYHADAVIELAVEPTGAGDFAGGSDPEMVFETVIAREQKLLTTLMPEATAGWGGVEVLVTRRQTSPTVLQAIAMGRDAQPLRDTLEALLTRYELATPLLAEAERAEDRRVLELALLRGRERLAELAEARWQARQAPDQAAGDLASAWVALGNASEAVASRAAAARRNVETLRSQPAPTESQLAAADPEVTALLARRTALARRLLETGPWPRPDTRQMALELVDVRQRIADRLADRRVVADSVANALPRLTPASIGAATEALRQTEAEVARVTDQVAALRPAVEKWQSLEAQASAAAVAVANREAELAQIPPVHPVRLAGTRLLPAGGSEAVADAEPDASPMLASSPVAGVGIWQDWRPMTAAAGAISGGLIVGLGLMLTFLGRRRVRALDGGRLAGSDLPVLGSIPLVDLRRPLTSVGSGASSSADASHQPDADEAGRMTVERLRAALESKLREQQGHGSFALAGVGPGSGTTSVAVGLAASLALSGSRVMLIDLAWVQKPLVDDPEAETVATRRGLGIDGVMDELGYLDDEDRERLSLNATQLTLPDSANDATLGLGFAGLLQGASLRRSLVQTRLPGLAVLSAMGQSRSLRDRWAGRMSSRWLSKLLQVCRKAGYDAVILDTGAATGSIEGMLGCGVADHTLLIVSNDETQATYETAYRRLEMAGARVLGTVLNRSGARRRPSVSSSMSEQLPAGRASGSGIFAAAVEGRFTSTPHRNAGTAAAAPLPYLADADSAASSGQTPAASNLDPAKEDRIATDSVGTGADPFSEPEAKPRPTRPRTPPRKPEPSPSSATPMSEDEEELAFSGHQLDPTPRQRAEVHVMDDLMDQLVDHAIETARREREAAAAAASDSAAQPTVAERPARG